MTSRDTQGIQKKIEHRLYRVIRAELVSGADLIAAIIDLCHRHAIKVGRFWLTGTVQSATIGVFDPSQEVYVTHLEKRATEVLTCTGTISTQGEKPAINAKIVLADQQGVLTGGHLFSDTIIREVEIDLQELTEIE